MHTETASRILRVSKILFPEKSWALKSRPPKRQLWAGDAVGGAPQRGSVSKKFKAPGRARADCLSARPPAGRYSVAESTEKQLLARHRALASVVIEVFAGPRRRRATRAGLRS